jgi:hypothetical protein
MATDAAGNMPGRGRKYAGARPEIRRGGASSLKSNKNGAPLYRVSDSSRMLK